jgi:hypothetical protein
MGSPHHGHCSGMVAGPWAQAWLVLGSANRIFVAPPYGTATTRPTSSPSLNFDPAVSSPRVPFLVLDLLGCWFCPGCWFALAFGLPGCLAKGCDAAGASNFFHSRANDLARAFAVDRGLIGSRDQVSRCSLSCTDRCGPCLRRSQRSECSCPGASDQRHG